MATASECSWVNQPRALAQGEWDFHAHSFSPSSCRLRPIEAAEAAECLRGRKLSFLGDSNIRDLGISVASFLSGVTSEGAEEKILKDLKKTKAFYTAHPVRSAFIKKLVSEQIRPNQTPSFTHPTANWTVEVDGMLFDFKSAWSRLKTLLREGRSAPDLAFVSLGVHSTYLDGQCAACWESMPSTWTHGRTFQPFLDHLCDRQLAASAAEQDGVPFNWPAVAWMTSNSQCAQKKRRYREQSAQVWAANQATQRAAAALDVPLLDWTPTFFNHTEECAATGDGVHVLHWVDHVRAQLLLSYICDESNLYRGIPQPTNLDRTALRCPHAIRATGRLKAHPTTSASRLANENGTSSDPRRLPSDLSKLSCQERKCEQEETVR